jgi:hypothetical protein
MMSAKTAYANEVLMWALEELRRLDDEDGSAEPRTLMIDEV